MFNLDIRLNKVSEIINTCDTLADIGSDHGYLPIYLLKTNKINRALITDMNKGPLDNAKRTTAKYNVSEKCDFLLGDGLNCLRGLPSPDVISICGMGGELIKAIISENEDIARKSDLVLQPMNNPAILRKYLLSKGYEIYAEGIVKDDYHFYQMFAARYSAQSFDTSSYQEADYEFADILISQKDSTMLEYLQYKKDVQEKIYINIKENSADNDDLIKKAENTLYSIKERIQKYEA